MQDRAALPNSGCVRLIFRIVPVALIALGILFVVVGLVDAPDDKSAAAAFRADPGCHVDLVAASAAASGACSIANVRIVDAGIRTSGRIRSQQSTPYAAYTIANGPRTSVYLADTDGRAFAHGVQPGTPGRALLFRGSVVRLAANELVTDTQWAPEHVAGFDTSLAWVGAGLIAFGLVMFWAVRQAMRGAPPKA